MEASKRLPGRTFGASNQRNFPLLASRARYGAAYEAESVLDGDLRDSPWLRASRFWMERILPNWRLMQARSEKSRDTQLV